MPKTPNLPYEWYQTLNIHLTTIHNFRNFYSKAGLTKGPARKPAPNLHLWKAH
ncbi:MAG: methionine biosynthesis protein MetW [Terriglobia bacterium]|jgi:hypothetical protein